MNSNKKTARVLEDVKINVKIKLSALWVAVMFLYAYADIKAFYKPGHIEEVMAGEVAGMQFTQTFLFGSAILMAIPIFMVFLSLALPPKVNRWTNIIVGIFHAIILLPPLLLPAAEIWAYLGLYMILEAVFIALIVWHAWKWPKQQA